MGNKFSSRVVFNNVRKSVEFWFLKSFPPEWKVFGWVMVVVDRFCWVDPVVSAQAPIRLGPVFPCFALNDFCFMLLFISTSISFRHFNRIKSPHFAKCCENQKWFYPNKLKFHNICPLNPITYQAKHILAIIIDCKWSKGKEQAPILQHWHINMMYYIQQLLKRIVQSLINI